MHKTSLCYFFCEDESRSLFTLEQTSQSVRGITLDFGLFFFLRHCDDERVERRGMQIRRNEGTIILILLDVKDFYFSFNYTLQWALIVTAAPNLCLQKFSLRQEIHRDTQRNPLQVWPDSVTQQQQAYWPITNDAVTTMTPPPVDLKPNDSTLCRPSNLCLLPSEFFLSGPPELVQSSRLAAWIPSNQPLPRHTQSS